ncbi:EAL domain-containing response regulator [Xanthomonas theicola]|uniref:Diguanylate phosphodiesterase n=1 Tax=Xanthomonas theicola TaxID=56464 RepID=A0A2S6ZDH4_9XANT|nr:EAL domain-containing response regulator [Xanthomonas theicola]PPT90324.1 diguanylate phosphodiesterase [Xanthomonas theicola]QNH24580.1 EAL domain-containing response regulator [Xanthomonas theicola]
MPLVHEIASLSHLGTILVVDDSQVQREHVLALCLRLGAVAVEGLHDGHAALARVTQGPAPGLLIVDLEMPGMDGVQLLDALARCGVRVPIVVVSQRGAALIESVLQVGRASGLQVLAGLEKPLRAAELGAALQAHPAPATPAARTDAALDGATDAATLHEALRRGDIEVAYQPKVDMRSGQVHGVEALARWRHPRNGQIAPDRFIALAEREGLIHALTASVADQAMARLAAWKQSGLRLTLAINLSPLLLQDPGLLDELHSQLQRHGLAPADVVLEITESSLVEASALGMLARLRLQGFGLSLDDYGTGFSSLQQLTRIPFTELKIDRIFVHDAHLSRNLRTVLESALGMAQRLGLSTVAEGIETVEDWRLLQQLGCDLGQGYLLARPMGGGALHAWLLEHQARLQEHGPNAASAAPLTRGPS